MVATPLYYSDFNDPSELNNYYYTSDSYRGVQITNGYLEAYLGLYGKSVPYAATSSAVVKTPFPSAGIKVKAKVSAKDGSNMSAFADVISGIKIQSKSGFDPSNPIWSNHQIHFGFSSPYQIVVFVRDTSDHRVYQSGSWDGSDTGWHELEVDLYADHIDFYVDGQLVYTYNSNPFNGDQVYIGIIAGVYLSSGYARADYLEIDQIGGLFDVIAYPSLTAQQTYTYTPVDATAYPSLTTTQTYTPPPPVYTPVDAMAYPNLTTQQAYTPSTPVYTPVDTLAYTNITIPQVYVSQPTQIPITPLPSVSQYYLLVFIVLLLLLLALSRRRS